MNCRLPGRCEEIQAVRARRSADRSQDGDMEQEHKAMGGRIPIDRPGRGRQPSRTGSQDLPSARERHGCAFSPEGDWHQRCREVQGPRVPFCSLGSFGQCEREECRRHWKWLFRDADRSADRSARQATYPSRECFRLFLVCNEL